MASKYAVGNTVIFTNSGYIERIGIIKSIRMAVSQKTGKIASRYTIQHTPDKTYTVEVESIIDKIESLDMDKTIKCLMIL